LGLPVSDNQLEALRPWSRQPTIPVEPDRNVPNNDFWEDYYNDTLSTIQKENKYIEGMIKPPEESASLNIKDAYNIVTSHGKNLFYNQYNRLQDQFEREAANQLTRPLRLLNNRPEQLIYNNVPPELIIEHGVIPSIAHFLEPYENTTLNDNSLGIIEYHTTPPISVSDIQMPEDLIIEQGMVSSVVNFLEPSNDNSSGTIEYHTPPISMSDIRMPQIQADVIEPNRAPYPFFVGLNDPRYDVNPPENQMMED
jgi:hypothetical protein